MRIYRKQIERITIIGEQAATEKAFDYCLKHGFRIVRSGPKPIGPHRHDASKYKIVAEREAGKE